MSKANQNLHIDDYSRHNGKISVSAIHGKKEIDLVIDEEKYHFWLRTSGRLDGCMDFYDPSESDGHGQLAYTITPEEYWYISDYRDICEDLAMYIVRHDMLTDTMDIFGSLGKILKNQNTRTL